MAISFNEIPINLRVPGTYIEVDNSHAVQGLLPMPNQVLMFGQMLDAGTATPGEPILVSRDDAADGLFGRGSMLARMVHVFKNANGFVPLYVLPLADADAASASTRDVTINDGADAAGTLNFYIAAMRKRIGVAAGDSADDIATAMADEVNDDDDLPVTATASNGVVTLTAKNKGIDAGDIDFRHSYFDGEALPPGVTLTVGDITEGTGNPDLTDAIDTLGDTWYQTFVMPYSDSANLRALEEELADRFGPLRQIQGHAFAALSGTVGEMVTDGESRNSPHITRAAASGVTIAPRYLLAAADAAVDAGEPDPARPRQTLALPSALLPVPKIEQLIQSERNTLLFAGVATHTINAGNLVTIERLVTEYQENPGGVPDPSYLDVTTMRTISYMRYTVRSMVQRKYPRSKLADDGTPIAPGQAVVTPNVMRGELVALFNDWMEIGIAEDLQQFKRDLIVERNAQDANRLDAVIPPNVINQLRVFAGQLQFRL